MNFSSAMTTKEWNCLIRKVVCLYANAQIQQFKLAALVCCGEKLIHN